MTDRDIGPNKAKHATRQKGTLPFARCDLHRRAELTFPEKNLERPSSIGETDRFAIVVDCSKSDSELGPIH